MISEPQNSQSSFLYTSRYLFVIFLIFISFVILYYLSLRLISQAYYYRANNHIVKRNYGLAATQLKMANHYNPNDFMILKASGDVYYRMGNTISESGEKGPNAKEAFYWTQKAKDFYIKAFEINNLDAEVAYALAKAESRLEQLYLYTNPQNKKKEENPYQPLKYYQQAVRLSPSGTAYNYAMARYLFRSGHREKLFSTIRTLAYIYPSSYSHLKKEKLWSPHVKEAFKSGLFDAIKEKFSPKTAHKTLSSILADENELLSAISHYEKALMIRPFENSSGDYINIGGLYLKNIQIEKAEENFITVLDMSRSLENDLEQIYRLFKKEGLPERFYLFFQSVSKNFAYSFKMEMFKVRMLIYMKRFQDAEKILTALNIKEETAEVYFWLYRIAKIEKNWNKMELTIQKASILDRENSKYHFLFSRLLKRLKKLEQAEKEAGLAIRYTEKSEPSHYDYRARIRWDMKYYQGAAEDWQKAISLKSGHATYHRHAAEAFLKLGDRAQAISFYKNALDLDPENARYKKRYAQLKGK